MYSTARYRSDLIRASKPVKTVAKAFGKHLRTLRPSKYFVPCLALSAQLIIFFIRSAFYTARRIINQ
jgi:hypothetical protein